MLCFHSSASKPLGFLSSFERYPTPKFIRILSTEVLRMEVPWSHMERGLGWSQVSSALWDPWQGQGNTCNKAAPTSLPKSPKGQRRVDPCCQGSGNLAQNSSERKKVLRNPRFYFKKSLEFCFLLHNLLRFILLQE